MRSHLALAGLVAIAAILFLASSAEARLQAPARFGIEQANTLTYAYGEATAIRGQESGLAAISYYADVVVTNTALGTSPVTSPWAVGSQPRFTIRSACNDADAAQSCDATWDTIRIFIVADGYDLRDTVGGGGEQLQKNSPGVYAYLELNNVVAISGTTTPSAYDAGILCAAADINFPTGGCRHGWSFPSGTFDSGNTNGAASLSGINFPGTYRIVVNALASSGGVGGVSSWFSSDYCYSNGGAAKCRLSGTWDERKIGYIQVADDLSSFEPRDPSCTTLDYLHMRGQSVCERYVLPAAVWRNSGGIIDTKEVDTSESRNAHDVVCYSSTRCLQVLTTTGSGVVELRVLELSTATGAVTEAARYTMYTHTCTGACDPEPFSAWAGYVTGANRIALWITADSDAGGVNKLYRSVWSWDDNLATTPSAVSSEAQRLSATTPDRDALRGFLASDWYAVCASDDAAASGSRVGCEIYDDNDWATPAYTDNEVDRNAEGTPVVGAKATLCGTTTRSRLYVGYQTNSPTNTGSVVTLTYSAGTWAESTDTFSQQVMSTTIGCVVASDNKVYAVSGHNGDPVSNPSTTTTAFSEWTTTSGTTSLGFQRQSGLTSTSRGAIGLFEHDNNLYAFSHDSSSEAKIYYRIFDGEGNPVTENATMTTTVNACGYGQPGQFLSPNNDYFVMPMCTADYLSIRVGDNERLKVEMKHTVTTTYVLTANGTARAATSSTTIDVPVGALTNAYTLRITTNPYKSNLYDMPWYWMGCTSSCTTATIEKTYTAPSTNDPDTGSAYTAGGSFVEEEIVPESCSFDPASPYPVANLGEAVGFTCTLKDEWNTNTGNGGSNGLMKSQSVKVGVQYSSGAGTQTTDVATVTTSTSGVATCAKGSCWTLPANGNSADPSDTYLGTNTADESPVTRANAALFVTPSTLSVTDAGSTGSFGQQSSFWDADDDYYLASSTKAWSTLMRNDQQRVTGTIVGARGQTVPASTPVTVEVLDSGATVRATCSATTTSGVTSNCDHTISNTASAAPTGTWTSRYTVTSGASTNRNAMPATQGQTFTVSATIGVTTLNLTKQGTAYPYYFQRGEVVRDAATLTHADGSAYRRLLADGTTSQRSVQFHSYSSTKGETGSFTSPSATVNTGTGVVTATSTDTTIPATATDTYTSTTSANFAEAKGWGQYVFDGGTATNSDGNSASSLNLFDVDANVYVSLWNQGRNNTDGTGANDMDFNTGVDDSASSSPDQDYSRFVVKNVRGDLTNQFDGITVTRALTNPNTGGSISSSQQTLSGGGSGTYSASWGVWTAWTTASLTYTVASSDAAGNTGTVLGDGISLTHTGKAHYALAKLDPVDTHILRGQTQRATVTVADSYDDLADNNKLDLSAGQFASGIDGRWADYIDSGSTTTFNTTFTGQASPFILTRTIGASDALGYRDVYLTFKAGPAQKLMGREWISAPGQLDHHGRFDANSSQIVPSQTWLTDTQAQWQTHGQTSNVDDSGTPGSLILSATGSRWVSQVRDAGASLAPATATITATGAGSATVWINSSTDNFATTLNSASTAITSGTTNLNLPTTARYYRITAVSTSGSITLSSVTMTIGLKTPTVLSDGVGAWLVDDLTLSTITNDRTSYNLAVDTTVEATAQFAYASITGTPANESYALQTRLYKTGHVAANVPTYVNTNSISFTNTTESGQTLAVYTLTSVAQVGANWDSETETLSTSTTQATFAVEPSMTGGEYWLAHYGGNDTLAWEGATLHQRGEQAWLNLTIANNLDGAQPASATVTDDDGRVEVVTTTVTYDATGKNISSTWRWNSVAVANNGTAHRPWVNFTINGLASSLRPTTPASLYENFTVKNIWHAYTPIATEESDTFVIGAHLMWIWADQTNVRGEPYVKPANYTWVVNDPLTGSTAVLNPSRDPADPVTQSSNHGSEPSFNGGATSDHMRTGTTSVPIVAPAAVWSATATGSDGAGNWAQRSESVNFISPISPWSFKCAGTSFPYKVGQTVNMTCYFVEKQTDGADIPIEPQNTVYIQWLSKTLNDAVLYNLTPRTPMNLALFQSNDSSAQALYGDRHALAYSSFQIPSDLYLYINKGIGFRVDTVYNGIAIDSFHSMSITPTDDLYRIVSMNDPTLTPNKPAQFSVRTTLDYPAGGTSTTTIAYGPDSCYTSYSTGATCVGDQTGVPVIVIKGYNTSCPCWQTWNNPAAPLNDGADLYTHASEMGKDYRYLNSEGNWSKTYTFNWTPPASLKGQTVYVAYKAGFFTKNITRFSQFTVEDESGSDPLAVRVGQPIVIGQQVPIVIDSHYINATARTGAASSIWITIRHDDSFTNVVTGANPVERINGSYTYNFTPALRGYYTVYVSTLSETGEIQSASTGFRADYDVFANLSALDARTLSAQTYLSGRINTTSNAEQSLLLTVQNYLATRGNVTNQSQQALDLAIQNYLASLTNSTSASTQQVVRDAQAAVEDNTNATAAATQALALAIQTYLSNQNNATSATTQSLVSAAQNYLAMHINATENDTANLTLAVQAYLAANGNSTAQATQALLLTVQDYLATRGNLTTAEAEQVTLGVQAYLANHVNTTDAANDALLASVQSFLASNDNSTRTTVLNVQNYLQVQANATNLSTQQMLLSVQAYLGQLTNLTILGHPIESDYIFAAYRFDEGSGTAVRDYGPARRNATLLYNATWSAGKYGGATVYEGWSATVDPNDAAAFQALSGNRTYEAWVRWTSTDGGQGSAIYATKNYPDAASRGTIFGVTQSNRIMLITGNGSVEEVGFGTSTLSTNTWYHLAVSLDSTNKRATFFVNGTPDGTWTYNASWDNGTASYAHIGGEDTNPNSNGGHELGWKGDIDEFAVYSRAISADEARALYLRHAATNQAAMEAYLASIQGYLAGLTNTTSGTSDQLTLSVQNQILQRVNATSTTTTSLLLDVQNQILQRVNWTNDTQTANALAIQSYLSNRINATNASQVQDTLAMQSYLAGHINTTDSAHRLLLLDVQNQVLQRVNWTNDTQTANILAAQSYLASRTNTSETNIVSVALATQDYMAQRINGTNVTLRALLLTVQDQILQRVNWTNDTQTANILAAQAYLASRTNASETNVVGLTLATQDYMAQRINGTNVTLRALLLDTQNQILQRVNWTNDTQTANILAAQAYLAGRTNASEANIVDVTLSAQNYIAQRVNGTNATIQGLLLDVQNQILLKVNWTNDTQTANILAAQTLLANRTGWSETNLTNRLVGVQSYLSSRFNGTNSTLRTLVLDVQNQILLKVNWTNDTQTANILTVQQYLAGRVNTTSADEINMILASQDYIAGQVNLTNTSLRNQVLATEVAILTRVGLAEGNLTELFQFKMAQDNSTWAAWNSSFASFNDSLRYALLIKESNITSILAGMNISLSGDIESQNESLHLAIALAETNLSAQHVYGESHANTSIASLNESIRLALLLAEGNQSANMTYAIAHLLGLRSDFSNWTDEWHYWNNTYFSSATTRINGTSAGIQFLVTHMSQGSGELLAALMELNNTITTSNTAQEKGITGTLIQNALLLDIAKYAVLGGAVIIIVGFWTVLRRMRRKSRAAAAAARALDPLARAAQAKEAQLERLVRGR